MPQSGHRGAERVISAAAPLAPPPATSSARSVEDRLAEIPHLDMAALRASWTEQFGRPPPLTLSRRFLELAAAYHVQAQAYGGLKPATRRRLLQLAAKPGDSKDGPRRKRKAPLALGTRLVREWHGRAHSVEVAEDGFVYGGRRYRSLSGIARTITGARWSGPRFFGL
jgi:hypothetical protein